LTDVDRLKGVTVGTSMSASIATPSRWIGCGRLGILQFPDKGLGKLDQLDHEYIMNMP
jgi:hypothetical protein